MISGSAVGGRRGADRGRRSTVAVLSQERPRAAAACPAEPSRSCLRRAYRYLLALVLTPGLRPKAAVVFYLWTVAGTSYYGLSHNAKILRWAADE